ncbi:MAG: porin family protein [Saprospiraceae bacterium]|nr:porin family protein [Saprospiraceae bacterium]
MKKILFISLTTAFWLFCSMLSTAQSLRFGINAGAGIAKFDYEPDALADSLDFFENYYGPRNTAGGSYKPTYSIAGVMEYDLSKDFVLSSGLQLNLKFSQFKVQSGYARDLNKYRFNVLYLQLPLMVHYRAGMVFLGAGGYAGWALSGKYENMVQNDDSVYRPFSGKFKFGNAPELSNLQRFDYGVRGAVGYGFKRLRLSLTLDQGLATLKASNGKPDPQSNFSPYEKGTLHNQAIYATATYYWLKK